MIKAGSQAGGEDDLSALTVAQLRELAKSNGYTLTARKKADIIAEIEVQANA